MTHLTLHCNVKQRQFAAIHCELDIRMRAEELALAALVDLAEHQHRHVVVTARRSRNAPATVPLLGCV
ncbi:MAG: hypothetical protein GXY58_10435 [Planctomycetaceae bacterium]|nr:hypothetical protein [Planctomycetaceae bacterium]